MLVCSVHIVLVRVSWNNIVSVPFFRLFSYVTNIRCDVRTPVCCVVNRNSVLNSINQLVMWLYSNSDQTEPDLLFCCAFWPYERIRRRKTWRCCCYIIRFYQYITKDRLSRLNCVCCARVFSSFDSTIVELIFISFPLFPRNR